MHAEVRPEQPPSEEPPAPEPSPPPEAVVADVVSIIITIRVTAILLFLFLMNNISISSIVGIFLQPVVSVYVVTCPRN